MTSSNVVIMFPKAKKPTPPQNIEELDKEFESVRKSKAEMTLDAASMALFDTMSICGVDVNNQEYIKDIFWMMEGIRALLYKKMDLEHEFHGIIDKFYVTKDDGDIVSCVGQYDKLTLAD